MIYLIRFICFKQLIHLRSDSYSVPTAYFIEHWYNLENSIWFSQVCVGIVMRRCNLIFKPVICKLIEYGGWAHGYRTIFGESFKIVITVYFHSSLAIWVTDLTNTPKYNKVKGENTLSGLPLKQVLNGLRVEERFEIMHRVILNIDFPHASSCTLILWLTSQNLCQTTKNKL